MIKRGLTLDNALNITPRIRINDTVGPRTGVRCRTVPVKMPMRDEGQRLAYGKLGRRASEADGILEMRIMGREVVV